MTSAGLHESPSAAIPATVARPSVVWLRLPFLYLVSRRVPTALGLLAALGAVLWVALHWRWNIAGGAAAQNFIPLGIETCAAAIIAVTAYGPFGEPERATGRWLPCLRLGAAVAVTAAAVGALAAGAATGGMPGGTLALLRNVAGMTGTGLLAAAVLGGAMAWVGPAAYLFLAEIALTQSWTTPWVWPARPADDVGAAWCAAAVSTAALVIITLRGPRTSDRE